MGVKLSPNEVLVKSTNVYSGSIGTKKTETDIMISFVRDQKDFDFVDTFLSTAQVRDLITQLQTELDYLENKDNPEAIKYYRVCNKETLQGLWYDYKGNFTGLIHNDFNFCANNQLEMDFDPEIVGWLSATESLESLWKWFTEDDIKQLQSHGWFIHEFEAVDVKFYDRFQHLIIKQDTSKVLRTIEL